MPNRESSISAPIKKHKTKICELNNLFYGHLAEAIAVKSSMTVDKDRRRKQQTTDTSLPKSIGRTQREIQGDLLFAATFPRGISNNEVKIIA